jgi:hypothetical protein
MQSAPTIAPPDPVRTAQAQTASNRETAITQAELNNYNQVSPDGTRTFTQSGTNADGTPQFTATTALSAPNRAIYDTNQATKQNIATIGKDQSARIGDLLGKPFDINSAVADKITSLGKQRLDPQFAAQEDQLRTRLANSGIQEGSKAFDDAYKNFSYGKNDAYNSLYLKGEGQAASESIAQRNQPINEITALMSGSQVASPTFSSTPQTSVAGTDIAGITQNSYLDANQQAQQSVQANNAMMGGLFGLAGTLGGAGITKYSDRRLKRYIRRIGRSVNGLNLYSFQYVWGGPFEIGLMADEVARVKPKAVSRDGNGFLMVDYSAAMEAA